MGYSTTAQVKNQVLAKLMVSAAWDVTESTGDVAQRIAEADSEINGRLAALGYSVPFATVPDAVRDLSILYARYACFRDLYAGSTQHEKNAPAQNFKDRFEEKLMHIEEGWLAIVDASGAVIANTKFLTQTADLVPAINDQTKDNYPNAPNGPLPDPPGVDAY